MPLLKKLKLTSANDKLGFFAQPPEYAVHRIFGGLGKKPHNLEKVLRGNLQNADQRLLDRLGHIAEATVVVLTFEDMHGCEWHVHVSLSEVDHLHSPQVPIL